MLKSNYKKWLIVAGLLCLASALILFATVGFKVQEAFSGKKWRLPSLVYARPLELFVGKQLDIKDLKAELNELGYDRVRVVKKAGQYAIRGREVLVYKRSFQFADGPSPAQKLTIRFEGSNIEKLKTDGEQAIVRLDPLMVGGIYPHDFEDRRLVRLDEAPQHLIDALIAVEDQGYYDHWGISPTGIARAIKQNVVSGRYVQGASTLTQQLVKNFFLTPERSLKRKAFEAVYAMTLELMYDKNEILETYLNEIYLGQSGSRAIHGFGLAAEFYFNKSISDLTKDEAALLVAIVNGPSLYNPRTRPQKALDRRNLVLSVMERKNLITTDEAAELKEKPLGISKAETSFTLRFPAYLDLVKRHLARDYDTEVLQEEGLKIFTAFDPIVQSELEKSIARRVKAWGQVGKSFEAAGIVSTVGGDVEAVAGGADPRVAGFNRALDSKRQIGSLVKPAIALAALRSERNYHLMTGINDEPIRVELEDGKFWEPQNYDKKSHGIVPLYLALAKSYNQAFVRLGMDVTPDAVAQVFYDLGIDSDLPLNPAMLLGSFGLSPLDVLQMYQTLASDGVIVPPRTVRYLVDAEGELVKSYDIELIPAVEEKYLNLLQFALQVVMFEGTGRGAYQRLAKDFYVAGKTGTSNDRRDSWFAGFSGDKVAVVWLGRDDNKPTPLTGSTGALPVWADVMRAVSKQPLDYRQVSGVDYLWVDEETGALSKEYCQGVRQIPFVDERIPTESATCIKSAKPIIDWFQNLFKKNQQP